jgi:hypothetical protein
VRVVLPVYHALTSNCHADRREVVCLCVGVGVIERGIDTRIFMFFSCIYSFFQISRIQCAQQETGECGYMEYTAHVEQTSECSCIALKHT